MAYELRFDRLLAYDPGKPGITVPVAIKLSGDWINFDARLDTGASCCIVERVYGELLGLDIESGYPQSIGTATGSFIAYGHDVTLRVEELEFDAMVYFAANPGFGRSVLGCSGFLDRVLLGLSHYQGQLCLSRSGVESSS
jgi:hypothetical protein